MRFEAMYAQRCNVEDHHPNRQMFELDWAQVYRRPPNGAIECEVAAIPAEVVNEGDIACVVSM